MKRRVYCVNMDIIKNYDRLRVGENDGRIVVKICKEGGKMIIG